MELNPYQSPATPTAILPPQTPTGARPTSLTVLGILNLLFGAMGVFGLIATWIMLSMPRGIFSTVPNPVLDALRTNETYRTFTYGATVLGFFSTIALIASGIGLLQMRPYGRTLAIGYGIYALLAGVVGVIVNVTIVFGPMLQNMQSLPAPQRAAVMGGLIGGVIGGCVGLVYPAILLFFMYRPKVVNALRR